MHETVLFTSRLNLSSLAARPKGYLPLEKIIRANVAAAGWAIDGYSSTRVLEYSFGFQTVILFVCTKSSTAVPNFVSSATFVHTKR